MRLIDIVGQYEMPEKALENARQARAPAKPAKDDPKTQAEAALQKRRQEKEVCSSCCTPPC